MKMVNSQLAILLAQRERQLGKRVSLQQVHEEAKVPISTVKNLVYNTAERVTLRDIAKLCSYFNCTISDLFSLDDVPDTEGAADA
jgi:putative transcriptional regulator